MKRFIIIVLDSFGVGAMDDVSEVRPQDKDANTALSLLKLHEKYKIEWPTIINMGLMNAIGHDYNGYNKVDKAIFGTSKLKHFGADSFFGHQEISGTNPKKPVFAAISQDIDEIQKKLEEHNLETKRITKNGLEMLKVIGAVFIGDNMETDLGQAINVVGDLEAVGMDIIKKVGRVVRSVVKQPRVIAFGGSAADIKSIENSIITRENKYIGVDAPASGVYDDNYHVEHMGYGVDESKQVPSALDAIDIKNNFYGKVSNIVYNPNGKNFDEVDTDLIFENIYKDLLEKETGFYFLNIQETDLAGHAEDPERYIDRMNVSDKWVKKIKDILEKDDIMLIMADHGNDPTVGQPKHTRENVPLLIYKNDNDTLIDIGRRETMGDVGQTVADYFGTEIEFGTSFLDLISKHS